MKRLVTGIFIFVVVFLFSQAISGQTTETQTRREQANIERLRKILSAQEKEVALLELIIQNKNGLIEELKSRNSQETLEIEKQVAQIAMIKELLNTQKKTIKIMKYMASDCIRNEAVLCESARRGTEQR